MSSFGSQCERRLAEIRKAQGDVEKVIAEAAEAGTIDAVEKAVISTPPNVNGLTGTNTRTGALAQSWKTDSKTRPVHGVTELVSNMQYASYVNNGHRMDKHFVPGLIPNGDLLEKVDPSMGGIVVGTKTTYVPGLYMVDKARGAYRDTVRRILEQRAKELLK